MQKFNKYHSIENRSRKVDTIRSMPDIDCKPWVVLEKIHGANLSFTTDGVDVRMASRTMFLTEEDSAKFFKVGDTLGYLHPIVRNIKNAEYPDCVAITIYGELFGGRYPHPDIVNRSSIKPIQKNIYYSPHHHFYAFDICVIYKVSESEEVEEKTYENYHRCIDIFQKYGMLHAMPLFEGNFEECLYWSALHRSDTTTLPKIFGLPALSTSNAREGHVLKPLDYTLFDNGNRVIIKDKNKSFDEIQQGGSVPTKYMDERIPILNYVTMQRLENVMSKLGDVDELVKNEKNKGLLIKYFIEDTIEDVLKDFTNLATTEGHKFIKKTIQSKCSQMVLRLF